MSKNRGRLLVRRDAKIWFNDMRSQDPPVPPRGGYELGVLVAKELAKRYSVQTMAHWSQSQAKPKIQATLKTIAQTRVVKEH